MSAAASEDFVYPEFYSFPPFFTIQPVEATREKQFALWRDLIVRYHNHYKIPTLIVHECPLWKNKTIQRELSLDDARIILNDLISKGYGEWTDNDDDDSNTNNNNNSNQTTCRIFWRQPKEIAADIYEWAKSSGNIGSVCTMYELHSGDDVQGMSFQNIDEELLRRALTILEDQGKCAIFKGETSSEDGIKFV